MMSQEALDDYFLTAAQNILVGEAGQKTQRSVAAPPKPRAAPKDETDAADDCAGPRLVNCVCSDRPLVEHPEALPYAKPVNLDTLAKTKMLVGGAFSFMCTVRLDCVSEWSRVFDFSIEPDENSITAGTIARTNHLHFTVFQGSRPFAVRVNDFFELGCEVTMLCTVSQSGHMKVFRDGALVGSNFSGAAPAPIERPHMIVGGHFHFTKQSFRGKISNVKLWDQEVSWATATEVRPGMKKLEDQDAKGEADETARLRLDRKAIPVLEHLPALPGARPINLDPLAKVLLGGAFSLMCIVRMDCLNEWCRVFDFSIRADDGSITAGTIGRSKDLHFTVCQGVRPFSVRVNRFFELGWEFTALFTVSSSGHMKVFRDGELVGENLDGAAPAPIKRPNMIVGSHFHFTKQNFCGKISDVKVWDQEVSWATATEEAPPAAPEPCAEASSKKAGSTGSDTASGTGSVGGDLDSCDGSES